ncbi:MAG: DUF554 domain-containing protein [Spirochaetaceae bacterium]|jgi:uncharacterized membrane protein YqgA involved in biofilm formation|nr:DUF554 domain-containing protein [Spirochaetaceae bacterium]
MIGPIVNAVVIAVCAFAGCFFLRGVPRRFEEILKQAIGLSIIFIGVKGAMVNENALLLILSLVIGAVLGELINLDKWSRRLGEWAENRMRFGNKNLKQGDFSKGFVEASILFCTGSMAVVGSMESGLHGNHEILFAKSILDGSISIVFASSLGVGVIFSAIPVVIYEAALALLAKAASGFLTENIVREMSAAGSLVVSAIGFNFLGVKEIKAANLIPAVFAPPIIIALAKNFSF